MEDTARLLAERWPAGPPPSPVVPLLHSLWGRVEEWAGSAYTAAQGTLFGWAMAAENAAHHDSSVHPFAAAEAQLLRMEARLRTPVNNFE